MPGTRYLLQRRLDAFLFGPDARLLEVEFAFDAPARLVGDTTLAQQLVDVFAFQRDQIGARVRRCRSRVAVAELSFWQAAEPVIVPGAQDRQSFCWNTVIGGEFFEPALRELQRIGPGGKLGFLLPVALVGGV